MGAYSEIDLETKCGENEPLNRDDKAEAILLDAAAAETTKIQEAADAAKDEEDRRAHEAAEAERKAQWEKKQEEKKQALKEQMDRLAAMSDDEVMSASVQRVSKDVEKLTRRNMKECVSEYIQTLCLEDASFARLTMHPRKTMIHCFQYNSRKAWDYIQDELKASGIQPGPGSQGYGCDIPDDLCYEWAEEYYRDPEAKEDEEQEEKFVPRPYVGKAAANRKKEKKSSDKKKAELQPASEKKPSNEGQMTLLDFGMSKAG